MSVSELIPWSRARSRHPLAIQDLNDPLHALHREVNRLFDDVWHGFDAPFMGAGMGLGMGTGRSWPVVELREHDGDLELSVELPGMDEKDVEVSLVDNALVLRGERKAQHEHEHVDQRTSERFYGRFERRIPLNVDIEADKVEAEFRNGILTITLPKAAHAQAKPVLIPVKKAA